MTAILVCPLAYAWNATPLPESGEGRVGVEIGAETATLPPFAVARQDRAWAALEARWSPAETVGFRLRYEGLAARWPDGSSSLGSGDLRLGGSAWVYSAPGYRLGMDVETKLPNAEDESGLGTDETDVETAALARVQLGELTLHARAGLLIMGNPTQFAAQDDAFTFLVAVEREGSRLDALAWSGGRVISARNPADLRAGVALASTPGRVRLEVAAYAGLSPFAPDVGMRMGIALVRPEPGA